MLGGTGLRRSAAPFAWAQHEVRHRYQRILLDDFLPRILDTEAATVKPLFDAIRAGTRPKPKLFPVAGAPFMPLGFAVAAYRLGHSMIRPGYRLAESPGKELLLSIFAGQTGGLRGFRKLDPARGIDWSLFFHATLKAGTALDEAGRKANNAKNGPVDEKTGFAKRKKIVNISKAFTETTPLWFYVLAEAEQGVLAALRKDPKADPQSLGARLGPVGAAIVAETFVGLMLLDPTSVLNAPAPFHSVAGGSTYTMVEMLRFIGALPPG